MLIEILTWAWELVIYGYYGICRPSPANCSCACCSQSHTTMYCLCIVFVGCIEYRCSVLCLSYITVSCTGWTFLNVPSVSLEWPSTGVFKAECPSTSCTAAHLIWMSPACSLCRLLPAHHSMTIWSSGILCCRPDNLQDPTLSDDKFRAALKTHFFSKYQNM